MMIKEVFQWDVFQIICTITSLVIGAIFVIVICYYIGRLFAKGILKEIDMFFGKKITDYINNKKKKEDENETQE